MLTNLGAPIPVPNLFFGGRYGVRDDLDVSLDYNFTAPIIPGLALDLIFSGHYVPIQPGLGFQADTPQRGWSVATKVSAHLLTDFQTGFVAVPAFEVAGGWRYKLFNPFIGCSLALNFYRPFEEVNPVMLSPFIGTEAILNQRVAISLRLTFFDMTYNYYRAQVKWVYLDNSDDNKKKYGLVGITLGISWDFFKGGDK